MLKKQELEILRDPRKGPLKTMEKLIVQEALAALSGKGHTILISARRIISRTSIEAEIVPFAEYGEALDEGGDDIDSDDCKTIVGKCNSDDNL